MNWGSWQAFWDMGGRGAFVWGSYGVLALALALEVALLRARTARARRDLKAGRGRGGVRTRS